MNSEENKIIERIKGVDPARVDKWVDNAIHGMPDMPVDSSSGMSSEVFLSSVSEITGFLNDYKEYMMMEECAIREVRTKLEVLNTEYSVKRQRNPINNITTRLKSTSSIIQKMIKNGGELSVIGIEATLNDVAGIRVVCEFIDDIYAIADALLSQSDITLLHRKDYIKNPKPNGYRSLHLVVSVPIFLSKEKRDMKVEVQIRTIAMDFWASLEHKIKYKKTIDNQEQIVAELKDCADTISDIDERMMAIRDKISKGDDAPTEDNILFEHFKNLDAASGFNRQLLGPLV